MGNFRGITNFVIILILISSLLNNQATTSIEINQSNDDILEIIHLLPFNFTGFSPWGGNSYSSAIFLSALTGGLYQRSTDTNFILEPMLALDDPQISENGLVYIVNLKPNLKFSNGNPLTADDVVFSYRVALTPEINKAFAPQLHDYLTYQQYFESNSSIIAIDDDTVQFTFKKTYTFAKSFFQQPIIEQEEFRDLYSSCVLGNKTNCDWDDPSGKFAQGAGPFKIKYINASVNSVTLIRNENYFDAENVWADQLVFKAIERDLFRSEAINLLLDNQADILDNRYYFNVNDIASDSTIRIEEYKENDWQDISLNHLHPVWGTGEDIPDGSGITNNDDVQANLVRKAMSHIVNREYIVEVILEGLGVPAATVVGPNVIGYDGTIEYRNFSVDVARKYMEMAGYNYADLGIENANGTFQSNFFNVTITSPPGPPQRTQWVKLYADELPKIGIGVKGNLSTSWDEIGPRTFLWPNNTLVPIYDEGGFDMAFFGLFWYIEMDPAQLYTRDGMCDVIDRSLTNGECSNFYNYDNPTTDQLIKSYQNELDLNKRAEILGDLQQVFYENLPVIPIKHSKSLWAFQQSIEGVEIALLTLGEQRWQDVKKSEWTVETNKLVPEEVDDTNDLNQNVVFGSVGVIAIAVILIVVFRRK